MRGYNAKLDEFYALSLNRVMDFTFAMTGNDADDFVKSMNNLVSGMTNMMTQVTMQKVPSLHLVLHLVKWHLSHL